MVCPDPGGKGISTSTPGCRSCTGSGVSSTDFLLGRGSASEQNRKQLLKQYPAKSRAKDSARRLVLRGLFCQGLFLSKRQPRDRHRLNVLRRSKSGEICKLKQAERKVELEGKVRELLARLSLEREEEEYRQCSENLTGFWMITKSHVTSVWMCPEKTAQDGRQWQTVKARGRNVSSILHCLHAVLGLPPGTLCTWTG